MLKEGPDVNSLGVVDSPAPSTSSRFAHEHTPPMPPKEMRTPRHAPPTPVIVPPTPSPAPTLVTVTRVPSSSSSNEVFYDAEDTEMQSKRRSLYRSPGTSSSPDLATLVRKAKERGGVVPPTLVQNLKDKKPDPPPPLPTVSSPFAGDLSTIRGPGPSRQRSSTSSTMTSPAPPKLSITPAPYRPGAKSARDPISPSSTSDWVMPSPRSRTSSKADSDKVSASIPSPALMPTPSFMHVRYRKPRSEPGPARFWAKCSANRRRASDPYVPRSLYVECWLISVFVAHRCHVPVISW